MLAIVVCISVSGLAHCPTSSPDFGGVLRSVPTSVAEARSLLESHRPFLFQLDYGPNIFPSKVIPVMLDCHVHIHA